MALFYVQMYYKEKEYHCKGYTQCVPRSSEKFRAAGARLARDSPGDDSRKAEREYLTFAPSRYITNQLFVAYYIKNA